MKRIIITLLAGVILLGLALARRIVQLHGGEISLRSDPAQGRGTVFTIRLPAESAG